MRGQIRTLDTINLQKQVLSHFSAKLKRASGVAVPYLSRAGPLLNHWRKTQRFASAVVSSSKQQQRHLSYEIAEAEARAD